MRHKTEIYLRIMDSVCYWFKQKVANVYLEDIISKAIAVPDMKPCMVGTFVIPLVNLPIFLCISYI